MIVGRKNRIYLDNPYSSESKSWYRGSVGSFMPKKSDMKRFRNVEEIFLKGWLPEKPRIDQHKRITAIGSCFAANIVAYLNKRNFNVSAKRQGSKMAYVIEFGDGLVNTSTIKQQFEWALMNKRFDERLWYSSSGQLLGPDESIRLRTRDLFLSTDVFIITLGLTEVWYNKVTGSVFWRTVPEKHFDKDKHGFKLLTVAENKENITDIYNIIKKYRPEADIIFTLSPVPLSATFRPVSIVAANSVSKSTLRASIDECMQELDFYYWPSYELVTELFDDPWQEDRRHPKQEVIDFIMTLFQLKWCTTAPEISVKDAWEAAHGQR